MLARLGDRADADDVGVLELCGGLAFVPKPALEQRVAGIARLQDLDGDGGAVLFPSDERPGEPPLAEQALQDIRAEFLAYEIGSGIRTRRRGVSASEEVTLQRGVSRLTYGASND